MGEYYMLINVSPELATGYSPLSFPFEVNELLKDQIAQMHAFSQVSILLLFLLNHSVVLLDVHPTQLFKCPENIHPGPV